MAADWIKMRTDLYRDPKVCGMSDYLIRESSLGCDSNALRNVMRNATCGALLSVWGVIRHTGKRSGDDLLLPGASLIVLDDIAQLMNFGPAMERVGWVEEIENGLLFRNFFAEMNSDPAEDCRKKNAERQRRHREKSNALRNVTVTLQSNARVEESRGECIPPTLTPAREDDKPPMLRTVATPPGCSPALAEAIGRWQSWRLAKDGRETDGIRLETMLTQARSAGWDDAKIVKSITFSISKDGKSWLDPEVDFQKPRTNGANGSSRETADERRARKMMELERDFR